MSVFYELSFWMTLAADVAIGLLFGWWAERLISRERVWAQRPLSSSAEQWRRAILLTGIFTILCGGLSVVVAARGQATDEVQPPLWGLMFRQYYHQTLIGLILVATIVDWDSYMIPDQITFPGMLIGLAGAFLSGQSQLIHLWVDWSQAIPGLRGPYFPDWFDAHRHWHGLAWSAAGLVVGAALTWFVRSISSRLMGYETLGFGDVTFLAMIGSFLGWQPTVCAFLFAPLLGLFVGIPLKWITNKPYIPYGPFLGAAAITVLLAWGPLWFRTRGIFGDWLGLLILAALAGIGLVLLLGLLIAYRRIPVRGNRTT